MTLIALAFCVVFAAIGVYTIYVGFKNRSFAKASQAWPTTGGRVVAAEVSKRISRGRTTHTYYTPQIRYAYGVAGANHESTVIRFGDLEREHARLAQELVAKYPAGSVVSVRYDPEDPKRACLESVSAGGAQIASGIAFIVVPLLIAAAFVLLSPFSGETPNLPQTQPSAPN